MLNNFMALVLRRFDKKKVVYSAHEPFLLNNRVRAWHEFLQPKWFYQKVWLQNHRHLPLNT